MPSRGKAKGNAWERELAAFLGKEFNLPFQRVPNSGAFLGGANAFRRQNLDSKQARIMTGDLIVPEELNNISFECKFYKTFDYHLLFTRNKQFESWIDQAKEGCNEGQIWFLCIKANRRDPIIAFQNNFFLEYLATCNFCSYFYENKNVYITDLKAFIVANKSFLLQVGNNAIQL
jgi:hypothetical protein